MGFALPSFLPIDEITQCRLIAIGRIESNPEKHEALDVFRIILLAALDPGVGAAHPVFIVLPLGGGFVNTFRFRDGWKSPLNG